MGKMYRRTKVNEVHFLARSVPDQPSKLVFNSALRASEQVNPEEPAQIRADLEKAKSERLMQLSRPTSHAHLEGQDSNPTVTTSPASMSTVCSRIERLKTRVTRIQGTTSEDKL